MEQPSCWFAYLPSCACAIPVVVLLAHSGSSQCRREAQGTCTFPQSLRNTHSSSYFALGSEKCLGVFAVLLNSFHVDT